MPINKYFKGDGEEVMASMQKRYGAKATANKDKQKPGQKAKPFQHKRKKKGKGRKGPLAREKALEAARGGPSGGPKSPQEAALEKKLGIKE